MSVDHHQSIEETAWLRMRTLDAQLLDTSRPVLFANRWWRVSGMLRAADQTWFVLEPIPAMLRLRP